MLLSVLVCGAIPSQSVERTRRRFPLKNRTIKFQLRLTQSEKQHLESVANRARLSLSETVRKLIRGQLLPPQTELSLKTYLELGQIGQNLALIAHRLSRQQPAHCPISSSTLVELLKAVASVDENLQQIRQQLSRPVVCLSNKHNTSDKSILNK
jgi:hypothetical protein